MKLVTPDGLKNKNDGATWSRKNSDDIFSRLYTVHECDGQARGRTETGQRLVPRLRIVSRGKNYSPHLMFACIIPCNVTIENCDELSVNFV